MIICSIIAKYDTLLEDKLKDFEFAIKPLVSRRVLLRMHNNSEKKTPWDIILIYFDTFWNINKHPNPNNQQFKYLKTPICISN